MSSKLHPSNTLYRGECTDFLEAMWLYRAQLEHEVRQCSQPVLGVKVELTDFDKQMIEDFKLAACKADEAANIYRLELTKVRENVIRQLRAKGDDAFSQFADALEADDFARLAI